MNYKEFAKKYLDHVGAFDEDGVYGGLLGESVMSLVETFSNEGHSGNSADICNEIFYDLNNAYASHGRYQAKRHQIWDEFWNSEEGKKIQAAAGTPGIMSTAENTTTDPLPE